MYPAEETHLLLFFFIPTGTTGPCRTQISSLEAHLVVEELKVLGAPNHHQRGLGLEGDCYLAPSSQKESGRTCVPESYVCNPKYSPTKKQTKSELMTEAPEDGQVAAAATGKYIINCSRPIDEKSHH